MEAIALGSNVTVKNYNQIKVDIEEQEGIVWMCLDPHPRPCFNPELISEVRDLHTMLEYYKGKLPHEGRLVDINYHVMDSLTPDVFNFGGDLARFFRLINERDEKTLYQYAKSCIDGIYPIMTNFRLPITTISLVRGQALGGGLEVALSSSIVIAERGIQMGFPEILFNIFPGMGAYQILSRRLSAADTEKLMTNGKVYTSDELFEMGVVDVLAEKGEGRQTLYSYIEESKKHRNGMLAMQRVRERVEPVDYDELLDVCKIWVDTAMRLSDRDLRMMKRLVKGQDRKFGKMQSDMPEARQASC